ncbi:Na+/H+ antiporter subunit D [Corynebacterium liangguodongii]|uniref:Na+/H+ antiporter subunit D n=1 Tax=Corynebacterium liangguodongii TaxID=2079535 RepID=A0A2S0WFY2_9CORY|nr:Na+/H+ antiporter subunit D [Corynebacterium liangguodongii]AWB84685.1 Na+/H+ antiporter subunit D [Corynebacterium liangguodongii]PWB99693.1 Na+/H+ antiporter subunit D [Corynebacterium liangguodongii]
MSEMFVSYAAWLAPAVPYLIAVPILLPALAAALILLFDKHLTLQHTIAFFTLLSLAFVAASLLIVSTTYGIQTLQVGGWDAPIGITLVADRLSTVFLTVSSIVLFAVMWYGISQGLKDGTEDDPVAVFLPSYMLLTMGVNLAFLAGDLFNLYVGFEIFLVASYILLTLGASAARVRVGIGYVMVSMASSMVFLIALALIYASVGTVNMAQAGMRLEELPVGTRSAIFATLLVAFGIKAAAFPLDAWLPDSYPSAASLVTAVFAGLLTKVGVYSIIRMRSTVFTDGSLDTVLMWVALATMIMGIMGALAQNLIKRLLSFTLVSHIGYMLFGVALGSVAGWGGAIFYAVHHILIQTTLFVVVGLIERHAGTSQLRRLGSVIYASPLIAILFFIPAMNMGGIPPFSGFLGKVLLLEAGARDGSWLAWTLVGGTVVTSLLTLYSMILVFSKGFLRDRADAPEGHLAVDRPSSLAGNHSTIPAEERNVVGGIPVGMLLSTVMLITASLSLTVLAGPVATVTGRAAEQVGDVEIYRAAVLGTDDAAPTRDLELGGEPASDGITERPGGDDVVSSPGLSTAPVPRPVNPGNGATEAESAEPTERQ